MLFRFHFGKTLFLGAPVVAALTVARPSNAQTPPPASSAPLPPLPAGGPNSPPPNPQPGYQQPAPGYQQPPPGYQQPPPGYQQPPPGYQQPPPGYQQPAYGQPGYGYYAQPPLPPPPKRAELQWSIRFNLFDLLFGRATAEIEYAFAGPLSLALGPQYIFADPRQDRNSGVTATGSGIYGELGVWVEGRPLRGYFLKGHLGYASITFHGDNMDVTVPETKIGVMFGSQSIYGGWFSLSGGFGVSYDTQSKDYSINGRDTRTQQPLLVTIPASGLFGNGWDLLSQIGIGGSF
jgi:hypothetical protein